MPFDILRSIIIVSKIISIKFLSSTSKFFYSLCCEKNLWLEKFKEKDLVIIDNDIKSVGQYLNEYRKISYARYTANCLADMIMSNKYDIYKSKCIFVGIHNHIKDILSDNDHILTKIKQANNIEKYATMFIVIGEKGTITLDNSYDIDIDIITENYYDKKFVISLICKIFYYCPLMIIFLIVLRKQLRVEKNIGMNVILNIKNFIFKNDLILKNNKY